MGATTGTISKKKLFMKALIRLILGMVLMGAFVFVSAGTLEYLNGWLFMVTLFSPMLFSFAYLMRKDPELLEKRMNLREKQAEQKKFQLLGIPFYFLPLIISGLDFRYGWSDVPLWLSAVFCITVLLGYALFIMVLKENSYASRIVEIQEGQKVIDTGLYSHVRHPMYSAVILMFAFYPLVLGSYYGMIPALFMPILLMYRAVNEEKMLIEGLPGYDEYIKKVKYRIIPHIW